MMPDRAALPPGLLIAQHVKDNTNSVKEEEIAEIITEINVT